MAKGIYPPPVQATLTVIFKRLAAVVDLAVVTPGLAAKMNIPPPKDIDPQNVDTEAIVEFLRGTVDFTIAPTDRAFHVAGALRNLLFVGELSRSEHKSAYAIEICGNSSVLLRASFDHAIETAASENSMPPSELWNRRDRVAEVLGQDLPRVVSDGWTRLRFPSPSREDDDACAVTTMPFPQFEFDRIRLPR